MSDVDALLRALTREEKSSLTAGEDMFSLRAVDRVGIPKVRVTDGPAGAKWLSGVGIGGDPSTWIPCASAVGASWDPELAARLGALVAKEALDRGCRGLLAPTANLHRALLAGRNFECFSEDPFLAGHLAAGYVRGVQDQGVFATVKHFVGNETEYQRTISSSVIDERSLREIYLLPFEIAVCEGGALAVMTGYNRVNGTWVTEQPELLQDILRDEWGFRGLVMTDWGGVVNAATSLRSGLDLEMPGPGRALGPAVVESIANGLVPEEDLDAAVRRLLTALDQAGALEGPTPPVSPELPTAADLALVRAAAAEGTVLLKNDGSLPLDASSLRSLAVIGEPARRAAMGGGGSAQLVPHRPAAPLEALQQALGDHVDVTYARGCDVHRAPARVGGAVLPAPHGFALDVFERDDLSGRVIHTRQLDDLFFIFNEGLTTGLSAGAWSLRARGTVLPDATAPHRLVLVSSAPARVLLDGAVVLDAMDCQPMALGAYPSWLESEELAAEVQLTAGVPVDLVVEYVHSGDPVGAFRVGVRTTDEDALVDSAVDAAAAADVSVVFVGTNHEWETEGRDRPSYSLPGRQDELVRRVAAVNPRTVVVVNAGSPVDLPWADEVAAVLQVWFGGQEMDGAVADVLTGSAEPGGRLPTTIPRRIEHCPSYDNFPGDNGEVRYGEGLFMGYRGYDHRAIEPRFPFGHGMSYTTFVIGAPELPAGGFETGGESVVRVPVTNTGRRPGSEVVQLYVAPRVPRLARPPKELKGFAKVRLDPGQTEVVELRLDDRSFAYWDPGQPDWEAIAARLHSTVTDAPGSEGSTRGWRVDPGDYDLLVATSATCVHHRATISVT